MTWFRVDDGFASHPKVIALQERPKWEASLSLWFLGGVYCAQQLTDGAITAAAIKRLGCDAKAAESLVAVGLWERTESGWQYHDWADHQPTRADVLEQRAQAAERQQRARDKRGSHATHNGHVTRDATRDNSVSHAAPPGASPVPTRPGPTKEELTHGAGGESGSLVTARTHVAPLVPATSAAFDRSDLVWFGDLAEHVSSAEISGLPLLQGGKHQDAAEQLFAMAAPAAKLRGVPMRVLVSTVFQAWFTPERARIRKGWIVAFRDDWPAELLRTDDAERNRQALGETHAAE